jgi:hypothetical protein
MVAAWYTRTKFMLKSMLIPVSPKNIGWASLESFWSQLQTLLRRYASRNGRIGTKKRAGDHGQTSMTST